METRPRAPTTDIKNRERIINTLLWMKNRGRSENTLYSVSQKLRHLAKHADLMNPKAVLSFIANKNVSNSTKTKLVSDYKNFCTFNNLEFETPKYRFERKLPLIPTTENIYKVISASSWKYSVMFTILEQTGIETRELATTKRTDIDADKGIINVQGCKGHNSRSFKLKSQTADARAHRLSDKLNDPQIRQIPLRNLRHHYATTLYDRTKDILLVKQRLGHKKIETTMLYTQLIHFDDEDSYTCRVATNVKEATELIENGFEYITEMDGLKLFRKRK